MESTGNSGDDDGVIFATPYCGAADPLWNTTFSWHTDHPDFTPCFQMTFLATVPCAFLLLASPFHFFRLRSSSRGYIKRSVFHYGKVAAISLMILLTLIDFGSTLWYRLRSEGYMDPVYIATPAILHVTLLIAGWLIHYERLRGCQSSGCLWIFWFLLVVALAFPLRSYINVIHPLTIDERAPHVKAILFFIFYALSVVQLFIHCFAEPAPTSISETVSPVISEVNSKEDASKSLPCPEQSSSFLSRITFNWFFHLALKGFRNPLTTEDVWELDEYLKTANLDEVFRRNWEKFGHYWFVLEKDKAKAEKDGEKKIRLAAENALLLETDSFLGESKEGEKGEETKDKFVTASKKEDGDLSVEIRDGGKKGNTNDNARTKNGGGIKASARALKNRFAAKKKEGAGDDEKPTLWSVQRGGLRFLMNALVRSYGKTFLAASFFKLCHDLLLFVPPYLLRQLIYYIRAVHAANANNTISINPNNTSLNITALPDTAEVNGVGSEVWKGYFFASLLLASCILQTILLHQYFHRTFLVGLWMRSSLIAAIYRKSLNLSSYARQSTTEAEIINLMSVDAQRISDVMGYINTLWSAPLQICLGIYMLWGVLGPATLAGIGVMVLLLPINLKVAQRYKVFQIRQMKLKDERIKMVGEILNGIKVLKLYGWEPSFLQKLADIRKREVREIKRMAYLNSVSNLMWSWAPNLVSLATYYTYVFSDSRNILNAETTFVSLAYFNILRFPMTILPMIISTTVTAHVSLKRINNFLRSEEIDATNVVAMDSTSPHAIAISDATFKWAPEEPMVLDKLDIKVKRGSLVAVVGPVGCGKSSLVSAILGNLHKQSGHVSCDPSVAYVAQQAWIQNATVEKNILFHAPLDEDYYDRVVWACALEPDLEVLTDGDQTEIGEKGVNISGGQKQRVSLARAVYSRRDVYLLDDPLSAVDSHVGKHLFDQVIGNAGLLAGKTRFLVTHAISFLDQVDYIYVINAGVVTEHGTYDGLMAANNKFTEFINTYTLKKAKEEVMEEEDEATKKLRQLQLDLLTPKNSETGLGDSSGSATRPRTISKSASKSVSKTSAEVANGRVAHNDDDGTLKSSNKDKGKLIDTETVEVGSIRMSVIKIYVRAVGICLAFTAVILFFLQQGFEVLMNLWMEDWSNEYEGKKTCNTNDSVHSSLHYRLGVYAGLTTATGIVVVAASLALAMGNVKASKKLHGALANNILRAPMSFFDTTPRGRIENRFGKDVEIVDSTIVYSIRAFLNTFFRVLGTIFIVSYGTPVFLAVCPFLFFIYFFAQRFYIPASRQLKRLESNTRSPIYSHFGESINGVSTIKAFHRQDDFVVKIFRLVDENVACFFPNIVSNRWLAIRLEFVGNCIMFFAALFAIINSETLSPGTVGLTLSVAMSVTQSLNWMVRMTSELENNIVAVERMKEYSEIPIEAPWSIAGTKPSPEWPVKASVLFDNMELRYRGGLELVLKGVSVDIKDGEKVGIVGRTGAGKSSLTLALFRLVELAGGEVDIDGVNVASIGLHDLRTQISIIPQEGILFSGTLRMNLDPFDVYSDEAVWDALEHSHLKEYVKGLEGGLMYVVSEGGENLSVGQRQLICLARALLRNSKILVLDEATAAVDMETDYLIQGTIRSKFSSCTILTIAHRLNTVMDYDKILVMSDGKVAQYDSPQNLLRDPDGIFYSMAKDANLT